MPASSTPAPPRRPRPVVLVLAAIVSVQFGGALAATLIPLVGVVGSVTLRLTLALVALLLMARPRVSGHSRRDWLLVILFGLSLAGMNLAFYGSLARLPIGVAVTIEFAGPLALAAALSRRARDGCAVLAAATGILLISGIIGHGSWAALDLLGIGLALTAGACWAGYIVLSGRVGGRFPRLEGLTLAMLVATVVVSPAGVALAGPTLIESEALSRGVGIALLSTVIPYSLEMLALRRLSSRVFGVLMSLEPAVAAGAGLIVLGQRLTGLQLAGMTLVVTASILVTTQARRSTSLNPQHPAGAGNGVA